MKQILLFLSLFAILSVNAQLVMTTGQTPQQMADAIAGAGVTVTNATMNTDPATYGIFSNAPAQLGFSDGIFLGSGFAADVSGPNTGIVSGQGINCVNNFMHQDADLGAILTASGANFFITEPTVLEFDATTQGDTLKFRYVFSSEEYTSYVCNGFNDIFGFFVSGPNPAGGSYVNQNIAIIPGTNTPVAINTVNDGTPNGSDPGCISTNTAYYAGVIPNIIFEGNTVVLEAVLAAVPCQNYHYKLAIADAGDCSFDSGVFIEAGSFTSNAASVASSTVIGQGFNTAIEGCVNGQFTFELESAQGDSVVNILIGGTATNGVDYTFVADTIDFAGDTTYTVIIEPIQDNTVEGIETVVIYVEGLCPGVFNDSAFLEIDDRIPLTVTPVIDSLCIGDSVNVIASGAQFYSWSPPNGVSDPAGNNVWLSPDSSSQYTLTYTLGSCSQDTIVTMAVSELAIIDITVSDESCPGAADGSAAVVFIDSLDDIGYLWSNGDTTFYADSLSAGTYTVVISDGVCTLFGTAVVEDPELEMEISASDSAICLGESIDFTVVTNLTNGVLYDWSPGVTLADTSATPIETTTYILVGTNASGCSISDTITIAVSELEIEAWYTDTLIIEGATIDVGVDVITITNPAGVVTYTWTPEDFLADADLANTSTSPTAGVIYTIIAESEGCSDTATITISIDVDFQMPNAFSPNGDGVNDLFYPENVIGGAVREFRVYNQWGQLMHDDADSAWDGYYNGFLQPQGTYVYYTRIANGAITETDTGSFTLVH